MLRGLIERRGETKKGGVVANGRPGQFDTGDAQASFSERAGLVEHDRANAREAFYNLRALDQDAVPCGA